MAHQPAASRSCSEFRTTRLRLCSRRRGDPTLSRYYTSWTGCQSSSGSHTSYMVVLTYTVWSTSTPVYLHDRVTEHVCSRTLRSSAIPLLVQPFTWTDFSRRAFRFSAPSVWNSLLQTVLINNCLFLHLDLKLLYSLRLSPNVHPTCRQRLSYDHMVLYNFYYYYYCCCCSRFTIHGDACPLSCVSAEACLITPPPPSAGALSDDAVWRLSLEIHERYS